MRSYYTIYLMICLSIAVKCSAIEVQDVNSANPVIYEISLRPWLYELSQKYGRTISRISDIPVVEFSALKNKGVDYVWLMGIWKLGQYALEFDRANAEAIASYKQLLPDYTDDDLIGSPYAVVDFVCNPELGSDADIVNLRKVLNGMGLKLMLDFVPNHSAIDSPYTSSNPEYYIRAPKGTQPPYDSSKYISSGISYGGDLYDGFWKDTVQWNYWNTDTRILLKSFVKKIASMSDGIRCDMAMVNLDSWGYTQPKEEFWVEAIREAKALYPNTIFLAEVYWGREQQLIDQGFDLVYEKWLLDTLATMDVNKVKANIDTLSLNYASHSNHFVENHDEPRAISKFSGKDYIANIAAMISYTLPGAKFINHGQLEGKKNKLEVHLRRSYKENGSDYSKWFYGQLIPIIARPVFHESSEWQRLAVYGIDSWRFMAWKVTNQQEKILVVINYTSDKSSCNVIVPDASNGQIVITELMSQQNYSRNGDDMRTYGLTVVVDAWNGQIFKY